MSPDTKDMSRAGVGGNTQAVSGSSSTEMLRDPWMENIWHSDAELFVGVLSFFEEEREEAQNHQDALEKPRWNVSQMLLHTGTFGVVC